MNFDDTAGSNLSRRLSLVALVCCVVSFFVAVTGLLGYLPGMILLGSVFSGYIPMAPSTALSFIFLSVILCIYRYRPITGILHAGCVLTAGLVTLFGLLKFGEYFTSADSSFESLFVPALDKLGDIPVGIMSYTTGLGFFIAGIGVLNFALKNRLGKEPRWLGFSVGASGGFVTLFSVLMLFGYIYKQPFLYGQGSVVPMALTTAIAFLFLGIGIIAANGPGQLFTRFFAGNSTRPRLLRVFIPLTILIILIKDAIDSLIEANAATLMTSTLLMFIGVTSMVVYWVAGVIGRRIDSAEDNVRESEKRFRSVFNQAAVGVARLAPDGTWLSVNKKLCDIVGYSHKELLSKTFQDITHPDDLQADLAYVHQLLEDDIQTYSMEKRYLKKNGDLVWINLTASLVRDTNNDPDYFISVIEDITERKQTEASLKESEMRLRLSMNAARAGSWIWNIETNEVIWDERMQEIFGFAPGTYDGTYETWMNVVHPDDIEMVDRQTQEALENGTDFNFQYRLMIKPETGSWRTVRVQAIVISNQNGDRIRMVGFCEDITEQKNAEEQLRISEKRSSAYLENSPACTKILDLNFNLQFMSQAGIVGLHIDNIEEYYGKPYPFCFYPDSFKVQMTRNLKKAKKTGEIFTQEAPVVDANGNELWFHSTIVPVKDDEDLLDYLMVVSIDTTERIHAEQALRESNEEYLNLMDSLGTGVVLHGPDTSIIFSNPKASKILGISPEQMKGKKAIDPRWRFVRNDGTDLPLEEYPVNKALRFMKPFSEYFIGVRRPDRKYITWVNVNASLVFDENKGIKYVTISFSDTTEQKQAEQAVKESEEKLNALFTSLTEMVVMYELVLNAEGEAIDYRISDCNEVFTEVTGIRKEDAIGKLASEVYQTDPPPYLEKYAKVALGGDPQEFNIFYPPLDKHFMISVVSPQAGKFATITTDITAMMQIQEMIVAKNMEMENYLYVASHDLRTPLVNIQGFSQRLKNQADSIKTLLADKTLEPEILHELGKITDEDIPQTLSFVLSNIKKMDTLINGLLKLSRTGTVEMNIQKIDMNVLLAKILQNLGFQIKEAQCDIHVDTLPECYGDAALLDQLFTNIISNALKYPDSERALEISVDAKNIYNKVVYTIRDTGKGIAQKHLGKIWDVFYRVDPRSDKTGEGIGLSLVKRIVEKHKGKVWAESEENTGSVFHIELHNRSFTEF